VALPGDSSSQQRGQQRSQQNGATGAPGLIEMATNPLALAAAALGLWAVGGYFGWWAGPVEVIA